jgi:hypothetical protein
MSNFVKNKNFTTGVFISRDEKMNSNKFHRYKVLINHCLFGLPVVNFLTELAFIKKG